MMVQLSIVPVSNQTSISEPIAKAVKIIHESGLEYRLTPMGTLIKGEWKEVMNVVKMCHEAVREDFDRVITQIKIDDFKDKDVAFDDKIKSVQKKSDVEIRK
ncbi:MTH1187 family thiamine-binding protein [candidate division KSB1 bacterium]|nr:MTH1187 family thiamine-binding protein [candidate division KSB1 bacterium]NIR71389.1 MTH1187 family thiamine-binding protein [candidate division KSB1 bacterium]NIS26283.1 MTH1187 family thiamine-binding protein [candidate division KSB1 bacterium]NIT73045.1 MTH1187 family thiamine-binding protein [candidate division KSB1 bacterium]NIU26953.1 MTH1187 family thiamine-binding protein [candidate division KSB1 bacterium]